MKKIILMILILLLNFSCSKAPEYYLYKLSDKDANIRKKAIEKLVNIGKPVVDLLIKALNDKNPYVRKGAIKALGEIRDGKALHSIKILLKDENYSVRNEAAVALLKLNWKPITNEEQVLYLIAKNNWNSIVKMGSTAIEPLIAAINDNNETVRKSALGVLCMIGNSSIEPLIKTLSDNNESVRKSVEEVLVKIGIPAIEQLILALSDNNESIRKSVEEVLVKIGAPAIEQLILALNDKNESIKISVVEILGEIDSPQVLKPLIDALKVENDDVRLEIVKFLGNIGGTNVIEPLIEALHDKDSRIRLESVIILNKIRSSNVIEPLLVMLNDKNDQVKIEAIKALDDREDPRVIEPLIALLKDKNDNIRLETVKVLGDIGGTRIQAVLTKTLKDKNIDVRLETQKVLDEINATQELKLFIAALNDSDEAVRISAAKKLCDKIRDYRDRKLIPLMVPYLRDWYSGKYVAEALEKHGWKPKSLDDKIHFWVAMRDRNKINQDWQQVKDILLKDVESNNYLVIENSLYTFIGLGKQQELKYLIDILNEKGTKIMAEAYLHCGKKELREAALDWVYKHGFYVAPSGGRSPVSWNSF
jgi:HEAT repeat protein